MKSEVVLYALYYLTLKNKKRTLRCVNFTGDTVSLVDEDTGYTFDMKKQYFLFRLRTASWHAPTLPALNETAPFFNNEDLENFRRVEIEAGERLPIEFASDLSEKEFEESIRYLLSASADESAEIKRRTNFYAEDLFTELQYFYDFPLSRTEKRKRELISAHNIAFNVMLDSRGVSWLGKI